MIVFGFAVVSACSQVADNADLTPLTEPTESSTVATSAASGTSPGSEASTTLATDHNVLVVRNVTLIDGTGSAPVLDAVVVVENGTIVAVGAESETPTPDNALVVDGEGGSVLPGLIDTHSHNLEALQMSNGVIGSTQATSYLMDPLSSGVTTYRDAGSRYGETVRFDELWAAIAALDISSPTIVGTGPAIAAEGNWAVTNFPGLTIAVADVPEAEAAVSKLLDGGADQIKIVVENAEFTGTPTPSLTPEQIEAITETAHERGAWVIAHVTDVDEAWTAINGGVDELTHWPGSDQLPEDLIQTIVSNGIPVGTTFGALTPFTGDLRRFVDAGGIVITSSDAPGVESSTGLIWEMSRMALWGLTPMEVIVAITKDAAYAIGLGDQLATIEIGKTADLLVVRGDPLEELAALRDLIAVIKAGQIVAP